MEIRIYGTRGSYAVSGDTASRYGGNTACVVISEGNDVLVLDGGTGILRIPPELFKRSHKITILLTHLHLDHIQGLGFFKPMYNPAYDIHILGPAGYNTTLKDRLIRYFSPPLFPVHFRDLPSRIQLHEIGHDTFALGPFRIHSNFICHQGPTLAFRVAVGNKSVAYFPDHEPVLVSDIWEAGKEWISGMDVAEGADILIHDAQYTSAEYEKRQGWGHCSQSDALRFAAMADVKKLLLFHHDPDHTDERLEEMLAEVKKEMNVSFPVELASERDIYSLD
ncbi:MAG: MBL fold metallo-hydrolase [Bacteroidetes bacterium]|nr:MBL fold metallo-hydrolase [Bacteroidota bacterium]